MKLNNFAIIIALTVFQFMNFSETEAAEIDNELAIIAAEQDNSTGEFLKPAVTAPQDEEKKKIEEPPLNLETEKTEPAEEIQPVTENPQTETVTETPKVETVTETPKVETVVETPVENIQNVAENQKPAVGIQNTINNYSNFAELVAEVKFIPLYIPKKSGYTITSLHSLANQTAEIRYSRRWEPQVALHIRTYKRQVGEELKDISGVHGVKWRIDMTSGTTVYISKIDERSHVAAWSSGNYTFSAYVENLSFAAFHSLVIDELVDLTTHYYSDNVSAN